MNENTLQLEPLPSLEKTNQPINNNADLTTYSGMRANSPADYTRTPIVDQPSSSSLRGSQMPSHHANPYVLQWSKLRIEKKIGEGAFGCVYLGELNKTEVAIKQLAKSNATEEDIKEFMAEAEIMK